VQPQFFELFQDQSEKGWNHVVHGRLSLLWTTTQTAYYPQTPTTWMSFIIRQIWTNFYDTWKYRCDTNHGTSKEDRRRRALLHLTPKIHQLYDLQPQTAHADQHIFETPIQELLTLPTHTLERWLFTTNIRIKASIKCQKVYNQQQLQPIRNFFQRVISPTILRSRQTTQHRQPIDTPIQLPNQCDIITNMSPVIPPPQQVTTKPRFNTRSIITFFQKLTHPNTPPIIPIPKSDYRPP
jgi:hypothetical protein